MDEITHLTLLKPPEFLFKSVLHRSIERTYRQGFKRKIGLFVDVYDTEEESRKKFGSVLTYTFVVMAGLMIEDGYQFCRAETGEWLVEEIPAK